MRCGHLDPSLAIISREYYEGLLRQYFCPINGVRDLAADFMQEWGYNPAEHGELLDCMTEEITEAMIEVSAETMRQHGLKDLRMEPEGRGNEQRGSD